MMTINDLAGQNDTHTHQRVRKIQDVHGYRCNRCGSTHIILEENVLFFYRERYLRCTDCNSQNASHACPECGGTKFDIEPDYITNCRNCGLVIGMSPPLYVAGRRVWVDNVLLKRRIESI